MASNFNYWLAQHRTQTGTVGDLARFVAQQPTQPYVIGYEDGLAWFAALRNPAPQSILEAFDEAWLEYWKLSVFKPQIRAEKNRQLQRKKMALRRKKMARKADKQRCHAIGFDVIDGYVARFPQPQNPLDAHIESYADGVFEYLMTRSRRAQR